MSDENHSRNARKGEAPDLERSPCPVVGIGASAGGLAALEKLFRAMPEDSGLAFVVVQHLHPERESHMTELIGRYTEMPVISVENGVHVQPDHVYVILPGQQLTIENGVLRLEDIGDARGPSRAIDGFLCSLAEDQEERAIGIILSGTGSNGTEGLKAIKAAGGVVLAQNPDTAEYPDMPRSAIGTGLIDVVSSPEQMPDVLVRYARHAYVRRSVQAEERAPGAAVPQLERVLALLGARGGHDFRMYKRTTLIRRIHRRMGLHSIERLADYHEFLGNHPDEVRALVKDLMISVTGFFRDPEAWELLGERVIAPLVAELDDGDPIRVWVSACATGEEAFSIALLIAEQAEALKKSLEVKIFATDTAEDNLSNARRGWFPAIIEQHVSQARLQRFFEPTNDAYRIKSELRDWVIFAPHNLLQDPPFFRMDLVTCRNFMIYLDEEAQRRVIAMFHFALRENGHLFLGSAETVGRATDLFETVSKKWRIYRRTGSTRHDIVDFPIGASRLVEGRVSAMHETLEQHSSARGADLAQRFLAERFAPAAVLIDHRNRIQYFHGRSEDYLAQPPGEPTRDLFALARVGLVTSLRRAVHEAAREHRESRALARLRSSARAQQVEITVSPLRQARTNGLFLVTFEPRQRDPAPGSEVRSEAPPGAGEPSPDEQFESELRQAREELSRTIQDLETSNEELKASNEEITSMNEELQSAIEELETSKEELQSLNEELNTVNNQLQRKVEQLEETTNDLSNLLASADIATIFLDPQFRIRWFTPAVTKLIDVIRSDIGRPIGSFATRFADGDLTREAATALERLQPVEAEFAGEDGRWYLRRLVPYRTQDNRIDGVVVTFTDVTVSKEAEQTLRAAHEQLEKIFDSLPEPVLVLGPDLRVRSANESFYEDFSTRREDTEGRLVYELGRGQWEIPRLRELLSDILPANKSFDGFEIELEVPGLGRRTMLLNGRQIAELQLILISIQDVTERKHWEQHQQVLLAELSHRVKNTLATVQALAAQTARRATSIEEFRDSFGGRLQAVGRAHSLLTRGNWEQAPLREIAIQALQPFDPSSERLRIEGEPLELKPRAAIALSQVLYELATNAAKHGALSREEGRIAIAWDVVGGDHGPALRVRWREAGGPDLETRTSTGFGMSLLERMITYELDGAVRMEFPPEGFSCEIEIPYTAENFQV